MKSITIRDLKNNPAIMTHFLEEGNSVFVTKHGKPIGITLPLDDSLVNQGIKELLFLIYINKGKYLLVNWQSASEVEDELKIFDLM